MYGFHLKFENLNNNNYRHENKNKKSRIKINIQKIGVYNYIDTMRVDVVSS